MQVAQIAQRFWENEMHQNKELKRFARTRFCAARFNVLSSICRSPWRRSRRRAPASFRGARAENGR
ncbi:MAG: hypothetical protein EOS36_11960 [Mesorhizobium sp.]|nr:MAG: hypothetical protein EOS36_11960 [Mesorhizobium sp.]RWE49331.1 MAG: hypothetical protein EOS79_07940 [Mesorhizobium sp.]